MAQFRVTRTIAPDVMLVFTWEGGTYIDVARSGDEYATEVINVWDSAKDESTVPFTKPAMRRAVDDWLDEYPRKQLAKEVREYW